MPELPEVENVRRGLAAILAKKPQIESFEFFRPDLRWEMPVAKLQELCGQRILSVRRRAKFLLFETPRGFILSHLGMTGSWREVPRGQERSHDHVYINLSGGVRLGYRDPRRFGVLDFVELDGASVHLDDLGPEPLEEFFTADGLLRSLRATKRAVKIAIMDPKVVVGVGNIYASEALFRARIRPDREGASIKASEAARLHSEIRELLSEAIDAGGSSISDYVQADGESGLFQDRFRVYDLEGVPCVVCRGKIRRVVQGGRSTFFCPKCQR